MERGALCADLLDDPDADIEDIDHAEEKASDRQFRHDEGDGAQKPQQVEEREDVADENARVRFGIFVFHLVDEVVFVALFQLLFVQSHRRRGMIPRRVRGGQRIELFPAFIFPFLFGGELLPDVFEKFHQGRIFLFVLHIVIGKGRVFFGRGGLFEIEGKLFGYLRRCFRFRRIVGFRKFFVRFFNRRVGKNFHHGGSSRRFFFRLRRGKRFFPARRPFRGRV